MKQFFTGLIAFSMFLSPDAVAYNSGSVSFTIDNDGIVGTDKNYTNGIFLAYHSPSSPLLSNVAPGAIYQIAKYLPLDKESAKGWNIVVGQQIWTPEDIESTEPVEDERPYAGLLFLETSISQYSSSRTDQYNFMFGTVGPNSLAEQGQRFIHDIIGSDEPMGWDYQIENQIVFNLGYQGHRLISRHNTEPSNSGLSQYDFSGVGRINAGNYQSELAIGSVARWGNNLAHNFGTTGFSPGKFVDIGMLSSSPTGYFLFTGIEGRYRINDITIEGDRPSEVPDSNVEHLQATAVIGGIYYQPKWGVSLSFAITTPEFKEDKHSSSSIGSLEVFWRL